MSSETTDSGGETAPLPQRFLDNVWLWAVVAFVFFVLTYVVWGLIDLNAVPAG